MPPREMIIRLPNSHLRQKSRRIGVISDEVKKVIDEMKAATLDWEDHRSHELGVALAAIQIDQPLRIIIVRNDFDDKDNRDFSVFINPEITKYEGGIVDDFEGCLSVADVYGKVPRHSKIRLRAIDEHGREVRVRAEGFLARVFQHEIDHIKGVVFIDHIKDQPQAFYELTSEGKLEKMDEQAYRQLDFLRD